MSTPGLVQIETLDGRLLAGVTRALEEAARRSGAWLVCRPGCTSCCLGPFAITQLDAWRLRKGLAALESSDPARAARVKQRAAGFRMAIAAQYPGDILTGELHDEARLPESMDDQPCPVLDPETGLCDLYEARPITCRTFGPAIRVGEEALGACELRYVGASDEEIARCAVDVDPEDAEVEILDVLESHGLRGMTIVAFEL